jgi:hypothetical protein
MQSEDFYGQLLCQFLGRDANAAERTAMVGQAERAAAMIAAHPLGKDGGLFNVEPALWDGLMLVGARNEPC